MKEKTYSTIPSQQKIIASIFALPVIFYMHSIFPSCNDNMGKILFFALST